MIWKYIIILIKNSLNTSLRPTSLINLIVLINLRLKLYGRRMIRMDDFDKKDYTQLFPTVNLGFELSENEVFTLWKHFI